MNLGYDWNKAGLVMLFDPSNKQFFIFAK